MQHSTAQLRYLLADTIRDLRRATASAAEQRRRRLELEAEIPFIDRPSGPWAMARHGRPVIRHVVRWVERPPSTPMPPKPIIGRVIYVDRTVPGAAMIVERKIPDGIMLTPVASRRPAFFGRIGDRLDNWFHRHAAR